ncbi:hypothetical protein CALVIDRAFT_271542 [Calocera viscosa TUFC12733]|uniref:Uncharacterized protein n=1 Tax=Calocera viscosa (strain TUFC12733) TaxID=1330018 RepID=A0A167QXM7_CALVF|nr:hypothetical protein CALVIDRAFT_271542 [Calocera viscosa TUFC12733]
MHRSGRAALLQQAIPSTSSAFLLPSPFLASSSPSFQSRTSASPSSSPASLLGNRDPTQWGSFTKFPRHVLAPAPASPRPPPHESRKTPSQSLLRALFALRRPPDPPRTEIASIINFAFLHGACRHACVPRSFSSKGTRRPSPAGLGRPTLLQFLRNGCSHDPPPNPHPHQSRRPGGKMAPWARHGTLFAPAGDGGLLRRSLIWKSIILSVT